MPTPRPGRRVRGSTTGRPLMAALDLLGRRWTLRVLWELRDGASTFAGLQARCDAMSPSVLNTRLAELRDAGLLAATDAGYALTGHGEALGRALLPLSAWADAWARDLARGPSPRSRGTRPARRPRRRIRRQGVTTSVAVSERESPSTTSTRVPPTT